MKRDDPTAWRIPAGDWPSGFDPREEIRMLRGFARALLASDPSYMVELEVSEPGYMHVLIGTHGIALAKLLITTDSDDGKNWYYLYNISNLRDRVSELEFREPGTRHAIETLGKWRR